MLNILNIIIINIVIVIVTINHHRHHHHQPSSSLRLLYSSHNETHTLKLHGSVLIKNKLLWNYIFSIRVHITYGSIYIFEMTRNQKKIQTITSFFLFFQLGAVTACGLCPGPAYGFAKKLRSRSSLSPLSALPHSAWRSPIYFLTLSPCDSVHQYLNENAFCLSPSWEGGGHHATCINCHQRWSEHNCNFAAPRLQCPGSVQVPWNMHRLW